jgi:hypothetical protein
VRPIDPELFLDLRLLMGMAVRLRIEDPEFVEKFRKKRFAGAVEEIRRF